MSQIQLGSYVNYKQNVYLVTALRANAQYLLLWSPVKKPVQVKASSTTVCNQYKPAKLVEHLGVQYLVTAKDIIISLTSHKEMKWDDNHGIRKALLAKAKPVMTYVNGELVDARTLTM
jgi:hypothetical protein